MRRQTLLTSLILIIFTCLVISTPAFAEDNMDTAPVVMDGKELFTIKVRAGDFWPYERARIISERLRAIADDITIPISAIQMRPVDDSMEIIARGNLIMTINQADAEENQTTLQELSGYRLTVIQNALAQYRAAHSGKNLAINLAKAVLMTVALFWFSRQLNKLALSVRQLSIEKGIYRYLRQVQGHKLLTVEKIRSLLTNFINVATGVLRLAGLYFYLYFVLGLFPWTKQYSEQLLDTLLFFGQITGNALLDYLPNAITILFIVILSRYFLKVVRFVFDQIKFGKLQMSGFHTEWADPTYKIFRFLVLVITVISIFPYIPGSHSLAFQGVSVFLGLLLSFGSSSAVANTVAGIALTYTRAFNIGDRVKIGDHEGDIMEKSLLATRIRTIKNADITIPNSLILNSPVINYSSALMETAVILNTRITLAFSASRKQAEELLVTAALATPDILAQPAPFVFQTTFNDFSVEYEINAYTQKPNRKDEIYSDLHANILDHFNTAGVEIMTAHYFAVRDGSSACIPAKSDL